MAETTRQSPDRRVHPANNPPQPHIRFTMPSPIRRKTTKPPQASSASLGRSFSTRYEKNVYFSQNPSESFPKTTAQREKMLHALSVAFLHGQENKLVLIIRRDAFALVAGFWNRGVCSLPHLFLWSKPSLGTRGWGEELLPLVAEKAAFQL